MTPGASREFELLVTGSSGYLWTHVIRPHLPGRFACVFIGRTPPHSQERDDWYIPFDLQADLQTKGPEVWDKFKDIRASVVLHLAHPTASSGKPFSELDAVIARVMARNLLEVAAKVSAKRILNASSGSVYGDNWVGYARESDAVNPQSAYAKSKLEVEQALADAVQLRFFYPLASVAECRLAVEARMTSRLLPGLVAKILREESIELTEEHLMINPSMGPQIGELIRTMMKKDGPAPAKIINVAGPEKIDLRDLIQNIGQILGKRPFTRLVGDGAKGVTRSMLGDSTLLLKTAPQVRAHSIRGYLEKGAR